LLGPQHYKDAVLELNASDSRGIDVSTVYPSQIYYVDCIRFNMNIWF